MKKTIKTLALITATIGVATVIKRVQKSKKITTVLKTTDFKDHKEFLNVLNNVTDSVSIDRKGLHIKMGSEKNGIPKT